MMKTFISVAAMMLASQASADSPAARPTLEMNAVGQIQIDSSGHVTDYQLKSKLEPNIAKLVDHDVRLWEFEPVVIDGKPATASTSMHIHLSAEPAQDKDTFRVRISEIRFGDPVSIGDNKLPRYPGTAVAYHVGAKVILSLRLDDTGKVIDVLAYQTSLDKTTPREHEADEFRKMFEKAAIAAVKDWHFDLTEKINGKPMGTSVRLPFAFGVHEMGTPAEKDGKWIAYVPGPIHPAPWEDQKKVADAGDASTIPEGQAAATDSRFHLKGNVAGTLL